MQFRRPARPAASPIPVAAALVTWLPIGGGIVLGTVARVTILLFGGPEPVANAASILCALFGIALAAVWLEDAINGADRLAWWQFGLCWAVLSIAFRAFWLGALAGGGWRGLLTDYRVWEGQPGVVIVLLAAISPLVLGWWNQRTPPHQERDYPG